MAVQIESTPEFVEKTYAKMQERLAIVRERLGRPLTLAEKVLYGHLDDPKNADLTRGTAYLDLRPDRITMQDATAQMALLQFLTTGKTETAVPTTAHADHLIAAKVGAGPDMEAAKTTNAEVYDFLKSACAKVGAGFCQRRLQAAEQFPALGFCPFGHLAFSLDPCRAFCPMHQQYRADWGGRNAQGELLARTGGLSGHRPDGCP